VVGALLVQLKTVSHQIGTHKGLMQSPFSMEFLNHSKFQNATTRSLVSKVATKDDFSWL
jgi:hypothetical protein